MQLEKWRKQYFAIQLQNQNGKSLEKKKKCQASGGEKFAQNFASGDAQKSRIDGKSI